MRRIGLLLVPLFAAAFSPAAAYADSPDFGQTSVDVTRTVPLSHRGETQWASYTVTVRLHSAELAVRASDGGYVAHSTVQFDDEVGGPALAALTSGHRAGCRGGGAHIVVWEGGSVVSDRTGCADKALAAVDQLLDLPHQFDQTKQPLTWPADPDGHLLDSGSGRPIIP